MAPPGLKGKMGASGKMGSRLLFVIALFPHDMRSLLGCFGDMVPILFGSLRVPARCERNAGELCLCGSGGVKHFPALCVQDWRALLHHGTAGRAWRGCRSFASVGKALPSFIDEGNRDQQSCTLHEVQNYRGRGWNPLRDELLSAGIASGAEALRAPPCALSTPRRTVPFRCNPDSK